MQFLLLIYDEPGAYDSVSEEDRRALLDEYGRYSGDLVAAGAFVGANPLEPASSARTVRVKDGETLVTDDPGSQTIQSLGGYYVIEAGSMDEAVAWAARVPAARFGPVEVRPIRPS